MPSTVLGTRRSVLRIIRWIIKVLSYLSMYVAFPGRTCIQPQSQTCLGIFSILVRRPDQIYIRMSDQLADFFCILYFIVLTAYEYCYIIYSNKWDIHKVP